MILVVILSCLVHQISCAVLNQINTGAKANTLQQNVLQQQQQDDVIGTVQQIQEQQMVKHDEIYGLNNDKNKDQMSASGFFSDITVNGRTDNDAADKLRNLFHIKQVSMQNSALFFLVKAIMAIRNAYLSGIIINKNSQDCFIGMMIFYVL